MNGLLIEWGTITSTYEKGTVSNLLFTTSNYSVTLTYDTGSTAQSSDNAARVYNKNSSGFNTYQTRNFSCYYIAIGY